MTREEVMIQALRNHIEALEETIKALEQEPILGKIRVEIENLTPWISKDEALAIVDKYRTESEDKENAENRMD